ncbi:DNA polymerase IV [candidate division KSB1 bacterium]|nr:DNA polymerase IV [candidate division KSB1 bacterium]
MTVSSTQSATRYIIHVDMDAFYAAIEEMDYPEYRGKPLVVGADPKGGKGRGVVSTANYEARKYGIRSALPVSKAYRLCPHAIFVPGRPQRYGEISRQVMRILSDFSPQIQQISIDEAFLDITQTAKGFGGPKSLAEKLKARIRAEVGLTASVGLASNMFVAKVASDLHKPDGLTICAPGHEKEFLAPLPISKLWGVGPKTEAHLRDYGFHVIGDLAKCSQETLAKKFGKWGAHLWALSNGIDHRAVEDGGPRKSISQEHTWDEDVADVAVVEKRIWKIADDLSRYMREEKIKGRVLTVKIRLEGFLTYTRRQTLSGHTNDAETMREVAIKLFRSFEREGKKVRLIGVNMSDLNTHGAEQLQLFDQPESKQKDKVAQLLDTLREKFGEEAAARASLVGERSHEFLGAEEVVKPKKKDLGS